MADKDSDKNDDLSNFGDLAKVDDLLESASLSIDKGEYDNAIHDFEQIIDITQSIFGENIELMEVRRKIKEVELQLNQIKRSRDCADKSASK